MTDEQQQLDDETKARHYDRIVRCAERVRHWREEVLRLTRELRQAKRQAVEAGYDLSHAMHPVDRARKMK